MGEKKGEVILLVDDTEFLLETYTVILEDEGYETCAVTSAEKMFEMLKTRRPSLIILDVEMPGMNGFDAARKLRASTEYRDIPIIFLTAHTNPEFETEGFDVGAVDYIYKPVLAKTLLMRVETQIMLKNQKRDIMKLQETTLKLQETTSKLQERIMRMSVGAEAV